MAENNFRFKGKLVTVERPMLSTVVFIPVSVIKKLPATRVRTKGTINGAPFALAVQYRKNGKSFFIISRTLRKAAGADAGDEVDIRFRIVSDKVEIPEELQAVLDQDPEALAAWKKLNRGHQRGLCHYVLSVRDVDARIRRALFIINKAKQGAYDRKPKSGDSY